MTQGANRATRSTVRRVIFMSSILSTLRLRDRAEGEHFRCRRDHGRKALILYGSSPAAPGPLGNELQKFSCAPAYGARLQTRAVPRGDARLPPRGGSDTVRRVIGTLDGRAPRPRA